MIHLPTPEQTIKKEIKRYIESIGGFWSCVTGGAFSKPGDPDIVACINGHYVGIEAKTVMGRLRKDQLERKEEIEDAHGIYLVVQSAEDLRLELRTRGLIED